MDAIRDAHFGSPFFVLVESMFEWLIISSEVLAYKIYVQLKKRWPKTA